MRPSELGIINRNLRIENEQTHWRCTVRALALVSITVFADGLQGDSKPFDPGKASHEWTSVRDQHSLEFLQQYRR